MQRSRVGSYAQAQAVIGNARRRPRFGGVLVLWSTAPRVYDLALVTPDRAARRIAKAGLAVRQWAADRGAALSADRHAQAEASMTARLWAAVAAVGLFLASATSTAKAALVDLGNGTVKDTTTNLIWLQSWNINARHNGYAQMN